MAEDRSQNQTLLDKMTSEVTPETSPLLQFLTNNAKRIMLVMVICFAAAAGYGVYSWQNAKGLANAQESLAQILVVKDAAARLTKLKEFAPAAPEALSGAVTLAIANTAMQTKNYDEALAVWESFGKDAKSPLYTTAVIGKAEVLALQGKHAEAIAVLEGASFPADSEATNLVNALIADMAEQSGNIDKAIAMCEKLVIGMAERSPEEASFWRQKAASLRAGKS